MYTRYLTVLLYNCQAQTLTFLARRRVLEHNLHARNNFTSETINVSRSDQSIPVLF